MTLAPRRARRRALLLLVSLWSIAGTTQARPAPPVPPPAPAPPAGLTAPVAAPDAVGEGLLALHRGEYGRAFEEFNRAVAAAPGDPKPLFFCVFSRWWQMVFADETPSRDSASWTAFEQAYDAATAAAGAR